MEITCEAGGKLRGDSGETPVKIPSTTPALKVQLSRDKNLIMVFRVVFCLLNKEMHVIKNIPDDGQAK